MTTLAMTAASRPISAVLTFILALACGLVAANLYYVQPVAGLFSHDYGMAPASAGIFVTVAQLGYAAGLLLVVPLGDILENRQLITGMLALLVAALIGMSAAPGAALFMLALVLVGITSSVIQIIVPFAGHLAPDASRGQTVGSVVSGLLSGVMLARPVSSFAAHVSGPRAIFGVSAVAIAMLAVLMWRALPERRPRGLPYFKAIGSLVPLLLQTRVLQRRALYQAALFGAFSLFWTAAPLLLAGPRFGFSQIGIGVFALAGAAGAVISPYAGRAADRGQTRLVTGLALGGGALAFLVAIAGGLTGSWPLLLAAALILDVATASNLVAGQRAIFAIGAEVRGRVNGLYLAVFFVGGSFGSYIASDLLATWGWTAVSLAGLAFTAIALVYFATETRGEA